jgi:hypothetical protein
MPGLVGVTARETSVAGVTVMLVDVDTVPEVAVIVAGPGATEAANPEVLIVATPVLDELQATDEVMSCVVLSENVPVVVNC